MSCLLPLGLWPLPNVLGGAEIGGLSHKQLERAALRHGISLIHLAD